MSTRSKSNIPARLARGRERFDKFRKKHKGYRRLPESLWSAAVKLAQTYGVNRTARTLRLDYSGLKKRLESTVAATPSDGGPDPKFIELLPSELTGAAECALECHRPDGTTIRIHLKGPQLPDLAALTHSLCNGHPGEQ
ncbi:MAG: hypothetical protein ISS71_05100 [Phycisphaerae bacterium]|nr:hypothetical protein [Phycisphaerae bacterium]